MGLGDLSNVNYWAVLYSDVPFSPDYTHSFYMPPINENNNQLDTSLQKYQINSTAIRGVGFRPNFDPAIKKRNTIRFEGDYKTFAQANYMMLEHEYKGETNYNFFCFVLQINILNNNVLEVEYEVDVLTTYLPYLTLGNCYIIRETSNDDLLFGNTMPEELQVKSYVMSKRYVMYANRDFFSGPHTPNTDAYVVAPYLPDDNEVQYKLWSGFPSAYEYMHGTISDITGVEIFENNLRKLSASERQSIPGIYIMPMRPHDNGMFAYPINQELQCDFSISSDFIATNGGVLWKVTNRKLLSAPFCYCRLWSTLGDEVILEPQLIGDATPTFTVNGIFNGSGWELTCTPRYGGNTFAYTKQVTFKGEVMTSWAKDAYDAYLANSGTSLAVSQLANSLMVAGGVASMLTGVGAPVGLPTIFAGASGLVGGMAGLAQASRSPDNGFNSRTYANLVNLILNKQCGFEFQYFVPSLDDCKRIDNFFSSYGYACGEYRTPVIYGNREGNYIQATNMELYGPAPGYALQRIREIFAKGVTFHDGPYLTRLKSGV